jgi:hypothetical protein
MPPTSTHTKDSLGLGDPSRTGGTSPVVENAQAQGIERRRQQRRAYPFTQMMAPIVAGNLPTEKDFRPVKCRNISTGGLAFLSPSLPAADSYVVALGSAPRVRYLICQVVHVLRLPQSGEGPYAVGCVFVGRTIY